MASASRSGIFLEAKVRELARGSTRKGIAPEVDSAQLRMAPCTKRVWTARGTTRKGIASEVDSAQLRTPLCTKRVWTARGTTRKGIASEVDSAQLRTPPCTKRVWTACKSVIANGANPVHAETKIQDPRWDDEGFNSMASHSKDGQYAFAWLRVGYARRCVASKQLLQQRKELPNGALHFGPPPVDARLFTVTYPWLTKRHPDPEGSHLIEIVRVLDQEAARDEDLIHVDRCSYFLQLPRTELEEELHEYTVNHHFRLFCYWRIQSIVIPRVQCTYGPDESDLRPEPFLERPFPAAESFLSAICHQMLYPTGRGNKDMIQAVFNPCRLENIRKEILEPMGPCATWYRKELRDQVWKARRNFIVSLVPAPEDHVGFSHFCVDGDIAWISVAYIKQLAYSGGPFPRRQELPHGTFVVGVPPTGCQKFVCSHCWESEVHPCPSGKQMRMLKNALQRLGAKDDDYVFYDFCSITQEAKMGPVFEKNEPWKGAPKRKVTADEYFIRNDVAYISGRTSTQSKAFKYAMFELGRLFSFKECKVIVLPNFESSSSFPGGDVWGVANKRPYHQRGWCCAEFCIASANNRIANADDEEVQQVMKTRHWPRTVGEYEKLMSLTTDPNTAGGLTFDPDLGVDFTYRGDRKLVQYHFFKMAVGAHMAAQEL